jgi:integrase
MATILQRDNGNWQAKIRRDGKNVSKTFPSKRDAERWATTQEADMHKGVWQDKSVAESTNFASITTQFAQLVLPLKKSGRQDQSRCLLLIERLGHLKLSQVTTQELSKARDEWSVIYAPASVKNLLGLINRIMKYAQIEQGIFLPQGLPVEQIRKPTVRNQRERRLKAQEKSILLQHSPVNLQHCILFAIATAARRGEIANLMWSDINITERYAHLRETKNGEPRKVPLTNKALELLNTLPKRSDDRVFGYTHPDSITTAFARVCEQAGISNLRFHDLRHEATSQLFEAGLNVIEAASVTGHKELRMLQRYTHLTPADIADKLNRKNT